jgi:thymidylate synthase
MKNGLDEQYIDLLKDILENGVKKNTRNGEVLSVFGRTIRYKFKDGKFPLLTTKKMYFKGIVTELLWFLRGDANIKYLVDNDCHIWVGDAYKNYLKWANEHSKTHLYEPYSQEEFINKIKTNDEFARQWGELGPIYGKQWRSWGSTIDLHPVGKGVKYFVEGTDQIANLINDLKNNPDSRRLMVNAWNVGELDQMVLPPCHYGFQVYTRELSREERIRMYALKEGQTYEQFVTNWNTDEQWLEDLSDTNIPTRAISLMWNQRSVDTFLGLPFNIASYGLLLEIIAKTVNMVPDELIGNLGDTHLYSNHIEQAKEQIGRELTDEERYNIWFTNNYETGMERHFDLNNLPNYEDPYYIPTPKMSREPFDLPKLVINKTESFWRVFDVSLFGHLDTNDFTIEDYKSHGTIKAPLSN